jgi:hypothetical protein
VVLDVRLRGEDVRGFSAQWIPSGDAPSPSWPWAALGERDLCGLELPGADAHSRSDGTMRLRVAEGTGTLYVRRAMDGRHALLEDLGPVSGPCMLSLEEGRTITGRVDGLDIHECARARVRAMRGRLFHEGGVGRDGMFSVLGLPPI